MNEGQSARQQIVEKIKGSSNILVTVSSSPSVDELSAALGLTSMLNGMNKHATAVVSGDVPPAITFLEPTKTFENTVDSLRDFIIALDKEKADHLRYKVEGDVVKIFITPYRTVINENDLEFSQGDYNVELVLALGVKDQDSLDNALSAHGKILHDAVVATVSCGNQPSSLGQIGWHEQNASSVSEMLVSLSEALKGDGPILDEQVATAFLTGIVASTDRFSNNKTSSKVMTMAAQLMAAGANQQLIAAKLEEGHEIGPDAEPSNDDSDDEPKNPTNSDGTTDMTEDESATFSRDDQPAEEPVEQEAPQQPQDETDQAEGAVGQLAVNHEKEGDLDEVAAQTASEQQTDAVQTAEEELAKSLTSVAPAANTPSVADLQQDLASANAEVEEAAEQPAVAEPEIALPPVAEPVQQLEEAPQEDADPSAAPITNHDAGAYVGDKKPTQEVPFNAMNGQADEPASVNVFGDVAPTAKTSVPDLQPLSDSVQEEQIQARSDSDMAYEATPLPQPPVQQAPEQPAPAPAVQDAVAEQFNAAPAAPYVAPDQLPPQPPSPIDFSQLPPPPPLPDFQPPQVAQLPVDPNIQNPIFQEPPVEVQPPVAPDPNQFKIPGQ